MKLLLEKMTPHSLMKKCIYSIAVLTVLLFLITGGVADNFFYLTLKPKLQHQYEVLISAAATKLSYIIHQNSQYMLQFWEDEKLCRDMMEWAQLPQTDTAGRQQVYRRVAEKLEPERRGEEEKGAIVSSRSAFTVLDGKYLFVPEEMEGCAGQIIGSDWFAALPEIFKELYDNAGVNALPRCYSPAFSMEGQKDFLAFALMKEAEGHTFYYIMVEPLADFKNIFKDLEQANIRDYALTGYGRQILYQSREDSRLEHLKEEVWNAICSGEQYEARVAELNQGIAFGARASYRMEQLTVAAVMDRGELLSTYRNFIQSVYFFLMAFLLFFLVLAAVIMGKSLSPLRILSRQMTDARQQNWNVDRKIQRKDEIGALADSFYSMMDQLQENLRQIREQDEQKKEIEYSLMVSQIDPHFIYNTLNTITYLAELNQPEDIMIINNALIEMLRDRLNISKLQIYDSLENEKKMVNRYITIQKYLCNNEISCVVFYEEECAKMEYPKNILQPFVENSILHGILLHRDQNKKLIPGKIRITVELERDRVVTTVEDNGTGMDEADLKKYFEELPDQKILAETKKNGSGFHSHVGIYNIRRRLSYLYGEDFYIRAENRAEGGLKIQLRFPRTLRQM